MTIAYLDVDDEITSAVGRLRTSEDLRVALVLPPGSRIATSRINFRLLARESREGGRLLAIVTPETSVRAVAVSAGLPAYASVSEYEAAVAAGSVTAPAETTAPPGGWDAPSSGPPATAAMAATLAAGGAAAAASGTGGGGPTDRTRVMPSVGAELPVVGGARLPRELSLGRRAVAAVVALIVIVVAAVLLYVYLPAATITVTPVAQTVGPVSLTVIADPAATAVDPANLVVPARSVPFPVSASDTFPSTGVKVSQTKATGSVTFTNYNFFQNGATTIPAGSIVSTSNGIQFATVSTITVRRAPRTGSSQASVGVQAVKAGLSGNVVAGSITMIPPGYDPLALTVTNPQATSGGTHTETKIVAQADYNNAVKALTTRLGTAMRNAVAEGSGVPAGLTLFPDTAQLGTPTADQPATALVGQAVPSFTLTLSATATATAVDQSQLGPLAVDRLKGQVPAGFQLFTDSVKTTVGPGTISGTRVSFPVQAEGQMWKPLDAAQLLSAVKGKSVDAARTYLAQFGRVSVSTWPGFVRTIPTLDQRVSLTVEPPSRAGP